MSANSVSDDTKGNLILPALESQPHRQQSMICKFVTTTKYFTEHDGLQKDNGLCMLHVAVALIPLYQTSWTPV